MMKIYKEGVLIIIYNSGAEFLFQKRDYNPEIKYQGKWVFLGGGIKPDETPEDAVKRELLEEINIPVTDIFFYDHFHYSDEDEEHLQYVFYKELNLDVSRTTLNEGAELKYFSWQDAQSLEFGFNIKTILFDYYRHQCVKNII
ncbi:MAG: NUDIX domain-containing protein [Spirochaetales bacterium]|nr:NUDIX domain-containing protein [Spirochaetales bacterium]